MSVPALRDAKTRRRHPVGWRPGTEGTGAKLLELCFRASVFELLLEGLGIGLRDAFLDGLRRTVDQVLGFLQAQAGSGADHLDDLDLLVADRREDDGELGLLLGGRGGATGGRRGDRDGGGSGGHAELLFHHLDEFGQVQDRHAGDGVEDLFFAKCHWMLQECGCVVSVAGSVSVARQASAFWSRTAARPRANFDGTSLSVCTNFATGACMVPSSLASSSSRLGRSARALTPATSIGTLGMAPPLMTSLSFCFAKPSSTLAHATGSSDMP